MFLDDQASESVVETSRKLTIPNSDLPDSLVEQKENEKLIQQAINSLPTSQKTAIILQRYEELSVKEISEILDCYALSVQSRLARAKENLYKKLLPKLKEI